MATMAMQRGGGGGGYVQRSSSAGLYEILDLLLDKGLVVDVFLRVSLVGIELLTVDARIVIASVDTYLRFAEAVNRLDLGTSQGQGLPDIVEGVASYGDEVGLLAGREHTGGLVEAQGLGGAAGGATQHLGVREAAQPAEREQRDGYWETALTERYPGYPDFRYDLAITWHNLGWLLGHTGDVQAAINATASVSPSSTTLGQINVKFNARMNLLGILSL